MTISINGTVQATYDNDSYEAVEIVPDNGGFVTLHTTVKGQYQRGQRVSGYVSVAYVAPEPAPEPTPEPEQTSAPAPGDVTAEPNNPLAL